MDWETVWRELAEARRKAGYENASQFASSTGFDRATAYRIEKHEQKPDVETIEEWLRLTSQESIGAFLTRCEETARSGTTVAGGDDQLPVASPVSVTHPDRLGGDTTASPSSPPSEGSHVASIVEGPELLREAVVAQIFERLGYALISASETVRADYEVRSRDEAPPRRRRADLVSLRKDPPDVRRLDDGPKDGE